ncbi:MAG: flagellar protein FlaG [Selenomonadaceae bacterium]|nr:flagellar protein FlaG [Selenomonadaceae bacterium]
MVGKLQDVVSAAVVVNAAERYNSAREGANQSSRNFESPAASVQTQSRFIVDAKSIQTDADSASKKKADDVDVQLKQPMEEKDLQNITQELNKLMSKINANLEFNYHKEAGMFSVALVDKDTNEVIKELPPEEMVKNIVKGKIWMDAFIGTFIDENA